MHKSQVWKAQKERNLCRDGGGGEVALRAENKQIQEKPCPRTPSFSRPTDGLSSGGKKVSPGQLAGTWSERGHFSPQNYHIW